MIKIIDFHFITQVNECSTQLFFFNTYLVEQMPFLKIKTQGWLNLKNNTFR